jgi:Mg/Co/Ni transporter MgtE (contains CBS domain)
MVEDESSTVEQYMTRDVATVSPDDTVRAVAQRIAETEDHSGFPVCDGRHVEGFVSAGDLLLERDTEPIFRVMTTDLLVAHPEMDINDAARVILRSGIRRLPVVDDAGNLVGIISNADVIRSQIERATPDKVDKLLRTLENIHDIDAHKERRDVQLLELTPTQGTVYADELEGRRYELERGLAEPLVVVETPTDRLLADGHHRSKAASRLGIELMDAYVIVIDDPVELGMAETARQESLHSIEDVEAVDYAHHPLVETTQRLQDRQ